MINFVVASDSRGRWFVVDIHGGFHCKIFAETDTEGKAVLLANMLNQHADHRPRKQPVKEKP